MTRRQPISDAQANAEAARRRESPYALEHSASQRLPPRNLPALLALFRRTWQAEVPAKMHTPGVEWETPGRIERSDGSGVNDPGGGNGLGAPRWNGEARAHLFGSAGRTDADGWYVEPMHWTVTWIGRRRPLMARLLAGIGHGNDALDVRVTCESCTANVALPPEYAEAIVRDAVAYAWRHYQDRST